MALPRRSNPSGAVDGPVRVRAYHEKSRAGCMTCKERRVKCDQAHPICGNCQKGRRECAYASAGNAPTFRGFRHVGFESGHPRNAIVVSEEVRLSVEYFCVKGLPILRKCQPSPLWDYLVAQLLDSSGSVRSITAALGAQQRIVERQGGDDQPSDSMRQASRLYAGAITSLRRSIVEKGDNGQPQIPLACLLMVVLESIRGSPANLLVHLQSGLHIMRALQASPSSESREVARLLRKYAVDATVFDALAPTTQAIQMLMAEQIDTGVASNPLAQVVQLVSDLLQSLMLGARDAFNHPENRPTSLNPLESLRPQQQSIELAINTRLATTESWNAVSLAAYGFAKAQCLLVKIYIDCAWTGRQCDYDAALDIFRKIIDIEETSLRLLHSIKSESDTETTEAPAAFSVGLSAQLTIMLVTKECRDAELRRRGLSLLDRCPRYDGVRDTTLIRAICNTIIKHEETAAGGPGNYISEHCRVHHYRVVGDGQGPGGWKSVQLSRRPVEGGALVVYDVPLEVG
ncbi:unnamed protein product [Zymoseptoria tritici ST99CH_3D7]|uniref:Zn(2)-C6 fungal-type domain-containing protein n=1 Tax=Zymoseptoria tritici (strain ST99CH_3D7) TaxID=1276538 RepID=A0A1X7RIA5_ZYMT9|nr:unnamed protein product [Zymoseptoria tritici ST99CH_3D7]